MNRSPARDILTKPFEMMTDYLRGSELKHSWLQLKLEAPCMWGPVQSHTLHVPRDGPVPDVSCALHSDRGRKVDRLLKDH
jgi:hypothetical protein